MRFPVLVTSVTTGMPISSTPKTSPPCNGQPASIPAPSPAARSLPIRNGVKNHWNAMGNMVFYSCYRLQPYFFACRSANSEEMKYKPTPTQMALSATLKAGQCCRPV